MILLDANILIYTVNKDSQMHRKARAWLETAISGGETVAFSWNVQVAFLRLTTRAGLFRNPLPAKTAFDIVSAWLEQTSVTILHPGPNQLRVLRDLLLPHGTAGNLTSDAHLAALAIEHGAELCSCDHDFARFANLKWTDPLGRSTGPLHSKR